MAAFKIFYLVFDELWIGAISSQSLSNIFLVIFYFFRQPIFKII